MAIQVPPFLGFMTFLPLFTVQKKTVLPSWGGDLRDKITGPQAIIARLNQMSMIKLMLIAAIAGVLIILLICTFILVGQMKTDLYVGDGSVFGCHVPLWRPPS